MIKEVPELNEISYTFLHDAFYKYLDENYDELIKPNISYYRSDVLYTIGMHIYNTYQHDIFINTLEKRINTILSSMNDTVINKEDIYSFYRTKYSISTLPSDKEFEQSVVDFVQEYTAFYHLYNKFVSAFNSDYIKLEWDNQKIKLFEKYRRNEEAVDLQHSAEYEVYQYVLPYYKKHLFRKNSSKYKPVIEKLPAFTAYATSIFDILFKYNILIDEEENVIYNEDGDISSAYEELNKIAIF